MKQVILKESSARSARLDGKEIHLKPGVPEFLDDTVADKLARETGWNMTVVALNPAPAKLKRPGIRIKPALAQPETPLPAVEGSGDEGIHKCRFCAKEFDTPQGMASHMRAKHKD